MRKYPHNNLRMLRNEAGLTLEQLAAKVEPQTNHDMIAKLENGLRELTHTWMNRLAKALHCAPEDFITIRSDIEDRRMIEKYRGLSESERETFSYMLEAMIEKKRLPKKTATSRSDSPSTSPDSQN